MPAHQFTPVRGRVERWSFDSNLLENRLGDPTEREVLVHLAPEGLEILERGGNLPVVIYLAPFTSSGPQRAGWKAFGETLPQRHERLVSMGKMKPVILVMPDTFTSLGGNQFVDSPVLGKWSTWLAEGLCPKSLKDTQPTTVLDWLENHPVATARWSTECFALMYGLPSLRIQGMSVSS